jgi:hypothetical protein
MESKPQRPTAEEASAALLDAEATRAALAAQIVTPSWFFVSLGVGIVAQIARFRRLNGVWLGGLASRVVLGTATVASVSYPVALGAAIWAAYGERWWLVAVWSSVGGAAYALSGRRWMRSYRGDPAAHARGESLAWLALVAAAAVGGLATLVLNA